MKILIDTLDLKEIKKYSDMNIIHGVTTNPTFSKRYGMKDDIETIEKVSIALNGKGEIHVEAFGETSIEIKNEVYRINSQSKYNNIVYKIPFTESGLAAVAILNEEGFKTNLHLIYSINQALLCSIVGSTYICPLVGRLDDIGHDALENIKNIKDCFDNMKNKSPKIMVSSVRNPKHVIDAFKIGSDVITIPPKVLIQMIYHPLTIDGFNTFKKDLESL